MHFLDPGDRPPPSLETMFVAEAMTREAIEMLAFNLASYLAITGQRGRKDENGEVIVERMLQRAAEAPLNPDLTDLDRSQFDADEAMRIALENLGTFIEGVRAGAL